MPGDGHCGSLLLGNSLRTGAKVERLIAGHKSFLSTVFPNRKHQFKLLAERQAPEYLFITCSDSRIVPDMILGTGPGDLFITRNAGNVVPVTAHDVDGVTATIEYAVEVLKVKHAILLAAGVNSKPAELAQDESEAQCGKDGDGENEYKSLQGFRH